MPKSLLDIKEEFVDTIKRSYAHEDLYKNPTSRELKEILAEYKSDGYAPSGDIEFRAVIGKKDILVWPGVGIVHHDVEQLAAEQWKKLGYTLQAYIFFDVGVRHIKGIQFSSLEPKARGTDTNRIRELANAMKSPCVKLYSTPETVLYRQSGVEKIELINAAALKEEFIDFFENGFGDKEAVYKDPTSRELRDILQDYAKSGYGSLEGKRFRAWVGSKHVLVWAGAEIVHSDVMEYAAEIDVFHNLGGQKFQCYLQFSDNVAEIDAIKFSTLQNGAKNKKKAHEMFKKVLKNPWIKTKIHPDTRLDYVYGERGPSVKELGEEFVTSVKDDDSLSKSSEVFKNPTNREFRDMTKEIYPDEGRYDIKTLIYPREVYCWPGGVEHHDMIDMLGLSPAKMIPVYMIITKSGLLHSIALSSSANRQLDDKDVFKMFVRHPYLKTIIKPTTIFRNSFSRNKDTYTPAELKESTNIYTKNIHIQHLEDLMFKDGFNGAAASVELLSKLTEANKDINLSVKWDGCIHPDTLVVTNKGDMTINELVLRCNSGEIIFVKGKSSTGDCYTLVLAGNCSYGDKKWIELELEDGSIFKMTEDHKVHTNNRGWVEAGQLLNDDDVSEMGL